MISSRSKKVACTVSAAALMLGVSSAATIGLHFMENYCGAPAYSGYPVSVTAFGVAPGAWENLYEMNTGYGSCSGPLGYTTNEIIDTDTSTNGLNPLPNGSINVTWFGPTANFDPFYGYAGNPPNYAGGGPLHTNTATGEQEIYATFIRDGINFGPPGGANNDQPGYWVDITGLKSLFTNTPFVVELMASGDSIETLTNALVIDLTNSITNTVSYPSTPTPNDSEGSSYYQGTGGGLSTGSAPLNADHIYITSVQPVHVAGQYNHAGTISGFIITDKPVVSMSPQSVPLAAPGDTVVLSAYAIGVPPLSYQWQFNGQNISGATNLSYSIATVDTAIVGNYDIVVTNLYGVATSKVASVGEHLTQSPAANVVYDSNPDNPQHSGVNMGATWISSNFDGTVTKTGVMSFTAADTNGISVPDNAAFDGTNGTITFWMQSAGTDQSSSGNNGAAIFGRTTGPSSVNEFLIDQNDNSGNLTFTAPNTENNFSSVADVSDSKWPFVALTFNQSSTGGASFYIDGALDSTNANLASWTWPSGQPLEIGYSTDTAWRNYNGLLDDVRFYSVILSSGQISSIYTSGDAGALADAPNLQLQYNFTAAPGAGIVLSWVDTTAVLQTAPAIKGPWSDVTGASPPYTIVPVGTAQFFRYRYTAHVPQAWVSNPYLM
jgi:hypothetical protein